MAGGIGDGETQPSGDDEIYEFPGGFDWVSLAARIFQEHVEPKQSWSSDDYGDIARESIAAAKAFSDALDAHFEAEVSSNMD